MEFAPRTVTLHRLGAVLAVVVASAGAATAQAPSVLTPPAPAEPSVPIPRPPRRSQACSLRAAPSTGRTRTWW